MSWCFLSHVVLNKGIVSLVITIFDVVRNKVRCQMASSVTGNGVGKMYNNSTSVSSYSESRVDVSLTVLCFQDVPSVSAYIMIAISVVYQLYQTVGG